MSTPILATKLYVPPPQPKVVPRQRLIGRLNEGLNRRLCYWGAVVYLVASDLGRKRRAVGDTCPQI